MDFVKRSRLRSDYGQTKPFAQSFLHTAAKRRACPTLLLNSIQIPFGIAFAAMALPRARDAPPPSGDKLAILRACLAGMVLDSAIGPF
jgi:hypothetical protein